MPAGRDRPTGQARPRRVHRARRTGRRRWRSGPCHRRCAPPGLPARWREAARPWDAATGALVRVLVPVAVDSPRRYTGAMNAIDERACGKPGCDNFGKPGLNIVGHGWFVTKSGRRRRYRCTVCGGTLSTNTGTAYRGLRCSRREFDQVASLRVEGVSISATARVTGHSRTTIARWLERAATAAACFNHRLLRDFDVIELQAEGSSRQGCNPAGASPAVSIAQVGHVAMPHPGMGNHPGDAWCKRPGRPARRCCGGCNLGA